jgi:hypothetical protein
MTEPEWLACVDPTAMWPHTAGKGERKHCLFDAACLRRVWHLLRDGRSRQAIESLERYADGGAGFEELLTAHDQADAACAGRVTKAESEAAWAACWATMHPREDPDLPSVNAADAVAFTVKRLRAEARAAERAAQAALLRDIFGNPFRPPPTVEPCCRTPAVVALAKALYNERRFGDLPVLADALEEAGLADVELLGHLRGPGPHARGCFVLDALLREPDALFTGS